MGTTSSLSSLKIVHLEASIPSVSENTATPTFTNYYGNLNVCSTPQLSARLHESFSGTLSPVHWGKFTVKETRVESLITQSDPLFIDQTAVRTAAHSFSLSQSVSHLTVCAQSNSPWNQWLAAIINELRWAWCLCPSLIVLSVCLGCKLSLVKVLLNFAKQRKLVPLLP